MRAINKYLWITLALLACASCSKENRWDCFTGMGDMRTEVRELTTFNAVYITDRFELDYRYDSQYKIEVTFGENILDHIITEVVNGELRISNAAKCNWVRDLGVVPVLTLYAPHFSRFENRSSSHIRFQDTLKTETFIYEEFEANGQVMLILNATRAELLQHTGRAIIEVSGHSIEAHLYSASPGTLDGSQLIAQTVTVNNSSFQDMQVYSGGYLFVHIRERGNVCYRGSPQEIDINREGSGTVAACP